MSEKDNVVRIELDGTSCTGECPKCHSRNIWHRNECLGCGARIEWVHKEVENNDPQPDAEPGELEQAQTTIMLLEHENGNLEQYRLLADERIAELEAKLGAIKAILE